MTSPDGITWTTQTSAGDYGWVSVKWASSLTLFVAISSTGNKVMTSPDGINWTLRTGASEDLWLALTWADSLSLFVAVGQKLFSQSIMTSPDGINWTLRTAPYDNTWRGVEWSPEKGVFIAVSGGEVGDGIMTSYNGTIWTSIEAPANNSFGGIVWSPEKEIFVTVSPNGDYKVMSSINALELNPQYTVQDNEALIHSRNTTLSGRDSFYIYGDYNQFNFDIRYMPFSDGLQINEWQENQTEVDLWYDTGLYQVKIFNRLTQIENPYQNLWKGTITMQE